MTVMPSTPVGGFNQSGNDDFKKAHANTDLDQSDKAQHHTLGTGPNQAAKGSSLADLQKVVDNLLSSFLNKTYPVGAIYMSVNTTSPSTLFGGTWVAWGSGRVPVGVDNSQSEFNTVEETGGEKTHTLTTDEMPLHSHAQYITANSGGTGVRRDFYADGSGYQQYPQGVNTGPSGGDLAHNNLQPYITCYMWKRTA